MKKYISCIALMFTIGICAQVRFGVKAGSILSFYDGVTSALNDYGKFNGFSEGGDSPQTTGYFGVFMENRFWGEDSPFITEVGLQYSSNENQTTLTTLSESAERVDMLINYSRSNIKMPVVCKYDIYNFRFKLGSNILYNLSRKVDVKVNYRNNTVYSDSVKDNDFDENSIHMGLLIGFEYVYKRMMLEIVYNHNFSYRNNDFRFTNFYNNTYSNLVSSSSSYSVDANKVGYLQVGVGFIF